MQILTKKHACFEYQFHQVGQGLFTSGCLYQSGTTKPKFLWVYDCGSVTSQPSQFWATQARKLKKFVHDKPEIDLLILSHFDDDHISGVVELLGEFKVKALLLPYVPLWRRLLIGFDEDSHGDSGRMSRYIDPIGYLKRFGVIEQVVIVPPGNSSAPSYEIVKLEVLPPEDWKIRIPVEDQKFGASFSTEFQGIGNTLSELQVFEEGQAITVEGLWEFCPYNSPKYKINPVIAEKVKTLRDTLLSDQTQDRQAALDDLKKTYDTCFKGGRKRNEISLFLYAGPIYETWAGAKLVGYGASMNDYPGRLPCYCRRYPSAPGLSEKCSILYSGDGYLHSCKTFNDLAQKLGTERMGKLGLFQVNHHGAKGNWKPGLAAKIDAEIAVFSSDPNRQMPSHPHPLVWQDYSNSLRIQVNQERHPFTAGGWMVL